MIVKNSQARLQQHGVSGTPAGWRQTRVKYLGTYINGYPFKPRDWGTVGRPILRIQDLTSLNSKPNRFDGKIPSRYLIKRGDLLISWSASLGVYQWDGEESWLNQHIFKVRVNRIVIRPKYFTWLSQWFIGELDREVHGSTLQHLTADAFGSFPVLIPPLNEQSKIADYLDRETAGLDALITEKERLLQLLAEKRCALIARAVTRGLDLTVPLRDSGIPWLGAIPAHWETERARWLFHERDQRSTSGDEELLTVSHLTGVTPRSEKQVYMFEAETKEGYKMCRKNDLVINTLWAWMGAMGVSLVDGIVSPAYNVYQPNSRMEPSYIDALVRVPIFVQEATRYSKGVWSSRLRLYPEGFFEIRLPVPPINEQREIVSRVARSCAEIDELHGAAELTVAFLKERRSALIAAAVTGQINFGSAA